ncbi:hypothetical protein B0H15DRAFT_41922 [Mycena belliarum]|uniref:Uncharacterized protein n=1 Tax=Mycena belliarum TaxID=1033014 RepID=A0AAD6TQM3_9AGAR|nr:hypothetical protein B0H15DRAFT_41922 [Mycena belliae]
MVEVFGTSLKRVYQRSIGSRASGGSQEFRLQGRTPRCAGASGGRVPLLHICTGLRETGDFVGPYGPVSSNQVLLPLPTNNVFDYGLTTEDKAQPDQSSFFFIQAVLDWRLLALATVCGRALDLRTSTLGQYTPRSLFQDRLVSPPPAARLFSIQAVKRLLAIRVRTLDLRTGGSFAVRLVPPGLASTCRVPPFEFSAVWRLPSAEGHLISAPADLLRYV